MKNETIFNIPFHIEESNQNVNNGKDYVVDYYDMVFGKDEEDKQSYDP